jgi:hypothetical protein
MSSQGRRVWLTPKRAIPLLTILAAFAADVLSLFGVIEFDLPEQIIIAVLGLIAVDALVERLEILEKLEQKLNRLPEGQLLRTRSQMVSVEVQAAQAAEICILAVSATDLIHRYQNFLEQKVGEGCQMRVILLDPECEAVRVRDLQIQPWMRSAEDIEISLNALRVLMGKEKAQVEVHLTEVFLGYSIFAVDLSRPNGTMVVDFHTYRKGPDTRPHLYLTPDSSGHWFDFYKDQFETVWRDGHVWQPA